MKHEDLQYLEEALASIDRSLQNSLDLFRKKGNPKIAGEVLMDFRDRVICPYLDACRERTPYFIDFRLATWEVVSPFGLLLIFNCNNSLGIVPVKNRTEATIETAKMYDRQRKIIRAHRRRAESIERAILDSSIGIDLALFDDGKFATLDEEDDRAWDSIDEAIADIGGLELKYRTLFQFACERIDPQSFSWSYPTIEEAIDTFDRTIPIEERVQGCRIVDRFGSLIYDGLC